MKLSSMLVELNQRGIITADHFMDQNEKFKSENEVKDRELRQSTTQYDLPDGSVVWVDNGNNIHSDLN